MMTNSWGELHTFIIYVVLGYTFLLPLVLICMKLLAVKHPVQRFRLYLMVFLMPPVGFVLYHTLLTKRCQAGVIIDGPGGEALHLLCSASGHMLLYILPLVGFFVALGILKGVAGWLLTRRLLREGVAPPAVVRMRVMTVLHNQGAGQKLPLPGVIFSNKKGFAAFTVGLLKPVIVLNHKLIERLSDDDLEALLAHELIHIKHKDNLKNWLLHLVRDITFFNPLSSVLLKKCLLEKEIICDREASRLIGKTPRLYASSMVRIWKEIIDEPVSRFALINAFKGFGGDLEKRVEGVLHQQRGRRLPALLYAPLFAAVFILGLLFLGFVC